jgi:hypothetical protein
MSSNNSLETEQIKPTVVRHLKPPPEIWELVHPVETQQRKSLLRRYALSAISLVLFVIVGALGAAIWTGDLRFRDVQKPTGPATAQPLQVVKTPASSDTTTAPSTTPQIEDTSVTQPAAVSVTDNSTTPTQPAGVSVSDNSTKSTSHSSKRKASIAARIQQAAVSASEATMRLRTQPTTQTPQQSKVAPDTDKKNSTESSTAKPKSNANSNSLLSAPPKSASTPKAKVIQWP